MNYNFKRDGSGAMIDIGHGSRYVRTNATVFIDAMPNQRTINIYRGGNVQATLINLSADTIQIDGVDAGSDVAIITDRLITEVFLKGSTASSGVTTDQLNTALDSLTLDDIGQGNNNKYLSSAEYNKLLEIIQAFS